MLGIDFSAKAPLSASWLLTENASHPAQRKQDDVNVCEDKVTHPQYGLRSQAERFGLFPGYALATIPCYLRITGVTPFEF